MQGQHDKWNSLNYLYTQKFRNPTAQAKHVKYTPPRSYTLQSSPLIDVLVILRPVKNKTKNILYPINTQLWVFKQSLYMSYSSRELPLPEIYFLCHIQILLIYKASNTKQATISVVLGSHFLSSVQFFEKKLGKSPPLKCPKTLVTDCK